MRIIIKNGVLLTDTTVTTCEVAGREVVALSHCDMMALQAHFTNMPFDVATVQRYLIIEPDGALRLITMFGVSAITVTLGAIDLYTPCMLCDSNSSSLMTLGYFAATTNTTTKLLSVLSKVTGTTWSVYKGNTDAV